MSALATFSSRSAGRRVVVDRGKRRAAAQQVGVVADDLDPEHLRALDERPVAAAPPPRHPATVHQQVDVDVVDEPQDLLHREASPEPLAGQLAQHSPPLGEPVRQQVLIDEHEDADACLREDVAAMLGFGQHGKAAPHGLAVLSLDAEHRDARDVHERQLPRDTGAAIPQQALGLIERLVGMSPRLRRQVGKRLRDQHDGLGMRRAHLIGELLARSR